jgi:hypothetical protein
LGYRKDLPEFLLTKSRVGSVYRGGGRPKCGGSQMREKWRGLDYNNSQQINVGLLLSM